MGLAIEQDRFEDEEYERFGERLQQSLRALETLLARPGFGAGPLSLGAELEVALVGDDGRPRHVNIEVLRETLDPRMTFELDRFNLESNLLPCPLAGRPFAHLEKEMSGAFDELTRAAERHRARVAMIGILPTLRPVDLESSAMTDTPRYRALSWALQRNRQEPFSLDIDGAEPLRMQCSDVTFEGAATSLQLHLRVEPGSFSRVFNAAQLATAPVLAVSTNSPTFLGHRLWDETRVALFKQAVDVRSTELERLRRKPRVCFGFHWNRAGAFEIFEDAVSDFEPLLPVLSEEDPEGCVARGATPHLGEIRLHQGTVWSWNRPVYDPSAGGHLRIEFRALPAGPSIPDMVANAALLIGLTLGLAEEVDDWQALPFSEAHTNFYRAAQEGIDSELGWPEGTSVAAGRRPARELVADLLEVASRGLRGAGVDPGEIESRLEPIAERCRRGITGASWQRQVLATEEARGTRDSALVQMLERYLAHGRAGTPVHEWPVDA